MGGTRKPWIALPSNGLLLHPACHDWVESHRTLALELGMLVPSGHRPVEVPVYRWNGWHTLLDDGGILRLPEPPQPLSAGVEVPGVVELGASLTGDLPQPGA